MARGAAAHAAAALMGQRFQRLSRLRGVDWTVAAESAVLIPFVRVSLSVRGFAPTARTLAARSHGVACPYELPGPKQVADAVFLVAGRRTVGASCLARSLVLWFLLRRRGHDAELLLGAGKPKGRSLPAHAWVEMGGVPLNEQADVRDRFGAFELRLPRLARRSVR